MSFIEAATKAMSPEESRMFKAGWEACRKHKERLVDALESIRDHPIQLECEHPEDDAFSMQEIAKSALSELAEHKERA